MTSGSKILKQYSDKAEAKETIIMASEGDLDASVRNM